MENVIDRKLVLKAPLDKVWNAVGTPAGFQGWFLCTIQDGDWVEGNRLKLTWPSGSFTEIILSALRPPSEVVYQWHPGGLGGIEQYPEAELTTVTMRLRETAEGTELHLTESGFENIPEERRLKALGMNSAGWDEETENIRKYVEA